MRTQIVLGVLAALAGLAAPANAAQATPDPSTDRELSAKLSVCNDCHGPSGMRVNATIPIPVISGQHENYLAKQLNDFYKGARTDEVMLWAAKTVTQEELRVAAAYFAKQKWPARTAGAASTPPPPGIAGCQACHDTPAAPRLAGQRYEYLVEAMRRFAEGERKNNDIMTKMMAATPPADREAMARYLSGL